MTEARLWQELNEQQVQCRLCSHYCLLKSDEYGKCGVRVNQQGRLKTLVYEQVAAMNMDPVEKKPLFHFYPGSKSFSIGTMGCNLACDFCQNSSLSQGPKQTGQVYGQQAGPEELVRAARHYQAASISYTYSEPTIFFELVQDTARLAKEQGLQNILVSNGFMSRQCLQELEPLVDAINVDLKAFRDEFYTQYCSARLKPVLQNLKTINDMPWWLEVTTLIIPGLNDSQQELQELSRFIAQELGPEVPWHISRFHPAHKMQDRGSTPLQTLEKAYDLGKQSGLHYIYLGNVFLHNSESTYCPNCGKVVIERSGFSLRSKNLLQGRCASCKNRIAGRGLD